MFNSLTGIITGKSAQTVFVQTLGIEWDVTVPASAVEKLPSVGQEGRLFTWLQHTEQLMTLYGFATEADRALFFSLLTVDGIGPKAALKIMGNIDSARLSAILESGDVETLQKVPGVGKKTAAKMLLQLKGKLSLEQAGADPSPGAPVPYAAVVTALVSMGYEKKQAEQAVSVVAERLSADGQFAAAPVPEQEDSVFRNAIVELAR